MKKTFSRIATVEFQINGTDQTVTVANVPYIWDGKGDMDAPAVFAAIPHVRKNTPDAGLSVLSICSKPAAIPTLSKQVEAATAENDHTGAAQIMAAALGGALGTAFAVILQEIDDRHTLAGVIAKSDQILRDAIAKDLRITLGLRGALV